MLERELGVLVDEVPRRPDVGADAIRLLLGDPTQLGANAERQLTAVETFRNRRPDDNPLLTLVAAVVPSIRALTTIGTVTTLAAVTLAVITFEALTSAIVVATEVRTPPLLAVIALLRPFTTLFALATEPVTPTRIRAVVLTAPESSATFASAEFSTFSPSTIPLAPAGVPAAVVTTAIVTAAIVAAPIVAVSSTPTITAVIAATGKAAAVTIPVPVIAATGKAATIIPTPGTSAILAATGSTAIVTTCVPASSAGGAATAWAGAATSPLGPAAISTVAFVARAARFVAVFKHVAIFPSLVPDPRTRPHNAQNPRPKSGVLCKKSGGDLVSHSVPAAVPSALKGLTSGFGM